MQKAWKICTDWSARLARFCNSVIYFITCSCPSLYMRLFLFLANLNGKSYSTKDLLCVSLLWSLNGLNPGSLFLCPVRGLFSLNVPPFYRENLSHGLRNRELFKQTKPKLKHTKLLNPKVTLKYWTCTYICRPFLANNDLSQGQMCNNFPNEHLHVWKGLMYQPWLVQKTFFFRPVIVWCCHLFATITVQCVLQ